MTKFTKIYMGEEALSRLEAGVDAVANAVKVTLGPSGRNVAMERAYMSPQITKDGVSVARDITFDDVRGLGCEIIKQASVRTAEEAGDGTTTSMVLAQAIFQGLHKSIAGGMHPIFLKRGMDVGLVEALDFLEQFSVPVASVDEIRKVATLSANGDNALGDIIAEAMEMVGKDGVIAVEESHSMETFLEFSEGLQLDRGYLSRDFIVEQDKADITMENPLVLLEDRRLTDVHDVVPALELAYKEGRPLLIVAHDLEGPALQVCVHNHLNGKVKVCAVKAPRIGEKRTQILENLATLTGGIVISETTGDTFQSRDATDLLGSVDSVNITSETTTFMGGHGTDEAIESKIAELRNKMERSGSEHDIEFYQQQMSQMGGGIAIIRVGAATEIELKEYKARVEDSLSATQSAVKGGIVPGGGTTLLQVSEYLESQREVLIKHSLESHDEVHGFDVLVESLRKPFMQIMSNAGLEPQKALYLYQIAAENDPSVVLNARTNEMVDALDAGIIDPTIVIAQVLRNAVSVSSTLATASCIITSSETEDYKKTV